MLLRPRSTQPSDRSLGRLSRPVLFFVSLKQSYPVALRISVEIGKSAVDEHCNINNQIKNLPKLTQGSTARILIIVLPVGMQVERCTVSPRPGRLHPRGGTHEETGQISSDQLALQSAFCDEGLAVVRWHANVRWIAIKYTGSFLLSRSSCWGVFCIHTEGT